MVFVSIGIPAHNEEKNIGKLLRSIEAQKLHEVRITEIIVVANGCEDRTIQIVKTYIKKNKKIRLLVYDKRLSMASAISVFIKNSEEIVLLMVNGDVVLEPDCIERLILPFKEKSVGITGPKVIPLNEGHNFADYFSRLWWRLFNKIALSDFRTGEVIAFRKLIEKVPGNLGSVENFITDRILTRGFQARHVPYAIVHNMGPQTVGELFAMRRRHNCHTYQIIDFGFKTYFPQTVNNLKVLGWFVKEVNWIVPKEAVMALASVVLEVLTRMLGYYDYYYAKRIYKLWPRIASTKKLSKTETNG